MFLWNGNIPYLDVLNDSIQHSQLQRDVQRENSNEKPPSSGFGVTFQIIFNVYLIVIMDSSLP